ncbi:MAG: ABC-F family ATP-binding cassette domain-containing protein, partial [Verrucomicrobia bacterium]|nr:ABC-F family ATP-binding cassette domain-containing protein [Verrucomicrobiota bacterium]
MLQVENLCKSYSGEPLFTGLSFSIQKGEKCAFVGRNGSGKTTLLKIIKGEESADGGKIHYPKGYKLGFLEQHIKLSEATVLEEALHGPIQKQPYEVESILFGLGFDDAMLDSDPSSLSGGYHLRLKLAKLLAEEPNLLLLDEPTNYLDIAGLRWLENYLKKWKGEIVCISHDRSFLDAIATHTMGLHRKEIRKYAGTTENFYQKILEEEEIYEKTRLNLDKKKKHALEYIERFGAKASKASQAKSKEKALDKMPVLAQLASLYDLSFSFSYLPFSGKKMTTLNEVFFSYTPSSPLIQNVSLEIEKGKRIAIIGKNGMGKSTLLQLIAGELIPQRGTVWKSDQTKIGYFGQTNVSRLNPDLTIEEEISSANLKLSYSQVRAICGQMMFSQDAAKKKISFLSGGEKSRVLLGKILASPTNLLLL